MKVVSIVLLFILMVFPGCSGCESNKDDSEYEAEKM
jgi:hypothetical protein